MNVEWRRILFQSAEKIRVAVMPFFQKKDQKCLGMGAGGDEIKQIDIAAEKALIDVLARHKVSYTLVSEESGIKKFGASPEQFYVTVDPLDGSTNANRGVPFMATSIAVSRKPELASVEFALVSDLYHNVVYFAERGKGAFRNNEAIMPSPLTVLSDALIGVDFNTYRIAEIASKLTRVVKKVKHLRHLGANALELCYVADGTTDGFIDIRGKLRVTDIAAAYLIIREAGAIITTLAGTTLNAELHPQQKVSFIAAGNKTLHKKILNLIHGDTA